MQGPIQGPRNRRLGVVEGGAADDLLDAATQSLIGRDESFPGVVVDYDDETVPRHAIAQS